MINTIVIVILFISLLITASLGVYTLLSCESRKKNYFIDGLSSAFEA